MKSVVKITIAADAGSHTKVVWSDAYFELDTQKETLTASVGDDDEDPSWVRLEKDNVKKLYEALKAMYARGEEP